MRTTALAFILGLGVLAAAVTPSLACAFHDQQASTASQQQTADAQPQSGTSTQ